MDFLLKLHRALIAAGVRFAIVGGHAVALHGAVRGTLDVDVVIPFERQQFLLAHETLGKLGLTPRLPLEPATVFSDREKLIDERNMLAWSFQNPDDPLQVVDILITHDLNELSTVKVFVESNESLEVIGIDDLIKMKRAAGRPQDLADVEALEKLK
jgi:hypothetical protein